MLFVIANSFKICIGWKPYNLSRLVRFSFSRIYVVFLSEQLGGQQAADLIRDRVLHMHNFRRVSSPAKTSVIMNQLQLPDYVIQSSLDSRQALPSSIPIKNISSKSNIGAPEDCRW